MAAICSPRPAVLVAAGGVAALAVLADRARSAHRGTDLRAA